MKNFTSFLLLFIALLLLPISINAQEEKVYTLYTHLDCPHCQKVDKFLEDNELKDIVLEKQLKNNDENYEELVEVWDNLGASDPQKGWPFMVYTDSEGAEQFLVGDEPIIAMLSAEYGIDIPEPVEDTPNYFLLLVGGLVLATTAGYGVSSMFKKEK